MHNYACAEVIPNVTLGSVQSQTLTCCTGVGRGHTSNLDLKAFEVWQVSILQVPECKTHVHPKPATNDQHHIPDSEVREREADRTPENPTGEDQGKKGPNESHFGTVPLNLAATGSGVVLPQNQREKYAAQCNASHEFHVVRPEFVGNLGPDGPRVYS